MGNDGTVYGFMAHRTNNRLMALPAFLAPASVSTVGGSRGWLTFGGDTRQ
jgi:hypothetical protein